MLKHIVMWRFEENASGKTRTEHAQWMKEHLEQLVGKIPEIRSLEVGVNTNKKETAYDAVLIATFDDKEALKRYQTNPDHMKVSEYCRSIRESRAVVDYYI